MRSSGRAMVTLDNAVNTRTLESLVRYYPEAGPDYASWSPNFNMHFGYWTWGVNPLNREAMLERANAEVARRLDLDGKPLHIVDLVRRAYETMCRCWVMEAEHLVSFRRCLEESGFDDIRVEDASWRAAPSVAHVPWVSLRFLLREGRHGLTEPRKNNLLAPIVMLMLGMDRRRFAYYFISARKRIC